MLENIVLQIVTGVIGTVTALAIAYFTKKTGIKVDAEIQAMAADSLTKQAEKAVAYAEEKAATVLKEHEITMAGKEKLEEALSFIDASLPDKIKKQIGDKLTDVATKEVEAALARIINIGATKLNAYTTK